MLWYGVSVILSMNIIVNFMMFYINSCVSEYNLLILSGIMFTGMSLPIMTITVFDNTQQ